MEPQPSWPGTFPGLDSGVVSDNVVDNVVDSAPDNLPRILTQEPETSDTFGDIKDGASVSHTQQSNSSKPGHVEKKVCSK